MNNLKIKSYTNVSHDFSQFTSSFEGADYQIWIDANFFSFDGDGASFSIKNLQDIFHEEVDELKKEENIGDIEGDIFNGYFEYCSANINKYLSYTSSDTGIKVKGELLNIASPDLQAQRLKEFWGIVEKFVSIPPKLVLVHQPEVGSYFDDYVMWGFNYVFLNEGQGLFIHGAAAD